MRTECKQARFEFHGLFQRKVKARFDGGKITSDAGVLLLRSRGGIAGFVLQGSPAVDRTHGRGVVGAAHLRTLSGVRGSERSLRTDPK